MAGKRSQGETLSSPSSSTPRQDRTLLWVADQVFGTRYLIETRAVINIVSSSLHSPKKRLAYDPLAANGILIATYGTKALRLTLTSHAAITWPFVIADVNQLLLGVDSLSVYDLLKDPKHRCLLHRPSGTCIQLTNPRSGAAHITPPTAVSLRHLPAAVPATHDP